jgi:hypothetical protein
VVWVCGAQRDLVLLLYRDEYYDAAGERVGEIEITIAENRNGPIGNLVLTFMARIPLILNYPTNPDADTANRDRGTVSPAATSTGA